MLTRPQISSSRSKPDSQDAPQRRGERQALKNAEILLRHTAFRLSEMLHNSSSEDRPLVEATLAQVNQAESETMLQVFRK